MEPEKLVVTFSIVSLNSSQYIVRTICVLDHCLASLTHSQKMKNGIPGLFFIIYTSYEWGNHECLTSSYRGRKIADDETTLTTWKTPKRQKMFLYLNTT